jgi:hypothetical protein
MAEGISTTDANSALDALYGGSINAAVYVQLHVGAPGSVGTANVAGNSTRQQITSFASAASGSKASSSALTWTSVSTAETYSKQSDWTASTSGTFISSGSVTASAVNIGDTFTIPSGSWTASLTTAS